MRFLFIALLAACFGFAQAAPYQALKRQDVIKQGGRGIAGAVNQIGHYAGDYPPKLDTPADRRKAEADIRFLASEIDRQMKGAENANLLPWRARIYWMGHNLDIKGYAEEADKSYHLLLQSAGAEDKPAVQEEYGRFLSSAGMTDDGEKLLRAAYDGGRKASGWALALNLIGGGKTDEAKQILKQYIADFPKDKNAAILLEALENGRVRVHKSDLKK